jgi:protein translocase SecG subunit
MSNFLPIAQIIVALLLIGSILLQQRGSSLGSAFGGSSGGFYSTRRGLEKKIFAATIILGAVFIVLALFNLIS